MSVPLYYLSLTEAAAQIRTKKLSPVALTQAYLRRIEALNPTLHAYITVTADQAMEAAQRAEAEIANGHYRGPLHGIPFAHKDNINTAGVLTTANSALLADWVPQQSAHVHTLLENAGAIPLGKLTLWEFAGAIPTPDAAFPAALNPWNTAYSPGGSSSGSGAAVAAGLCCFATGTDTGGSIRNPSASCGLVGMKPTFGRVSRGGVIPFSTTLDHVGPITRTVRDNILVLQVMAAFDADDPYSSNDPLPDLDYSIGKGVQGLRIGVPQDYMAAMPHSEECLQAFDAALQTLRQNGATVAEFNMPGFLEAAIVGGEITAAEGYLYHEKHLKDSPQKYQSTFRSRLLQAAALTDGQRQELQTARPRFLEAWKLLRDQFDVIATPGAAGTADRMDDVFSGSYKVPANYTRMYNVSGMPALVMPMGFSANGLPLSIQFAADLGREDLVYQVAAEFEEVAGHGGRHPPI